MVPNSFIRYSAEDEVSADEQRMRLFLFIYFVSSAGLFSRCTFSMEQLLRIANVKTPQRKLQNLQIYETLLMSLEWLITNEYISNPNVDLRSVSVDQLIMVDCIYEGLSIDGYTAEGKYRSKERFTKITKYEFFTLLERTTSRVPLFDLFIYSYIKSFIINRRPSVSIQEQAECCYLSYQQLQDACQVSRDGLRRSLEFLQNSELLDFNKPDNVEKYELDGKMYKATGKYSNLKTVFVLNRPGYEEELKAGIASYIKQNQKLFKYIGGGN